jgi:hypothetical protein
VAILLVALGKIKKKEEIEIALLMSLLKRPEIFVRLTSSFQTP